VATHKLSHEIILAVPKLSLAPVHFMLLAPRRKTDYQCVRGAWAPLSFKKCLKSYYFSVALKKICLHNFST